MLVTLGENLFDISMITIQMLLSSLGQNVFTYLETAAITPEPVHLRDCCIKR